MKRTASRSTHSIRRWSIDASALLRNVLVLTGVVMAYYTKESTLIWPMLWKNASRLKLSARDVVSNVIEKTLRRTIALLASSTR